MQEIDKTRRFVISTAGSIIYHDNAMKWLKENSSIIFLDASLSVIDSRLKKEPRAIVGYKEKGLSRLYEERIPIYRKWADHTIITDDKTPEMISSEIISL